MSHFRRILCLAIWLGLSAGLGQAAWNAEPRRSDDAKSASAEPSPSSSAERAASKRIGSDQFPEVDKLTNLTVLTLVVCVLGVAVLLTLIVVGARRIRRMTRSPLLKSKYDELESLRAQYRREVEGVDTPPPPSREFRR